MFEQALVSCPANLSQNLYIAYAQFEENYGLLRHALSIFERGTEAVDIKDKFKIYTIYIELISSRFGLQKTREIYEKALHQLPDKDAREMGITYAQMEQKLGEVDRSRAIFAYTSQLCDPRSQPKFWQTWQAFEVTHGNEDTFKEMLRIRRSVEAQYNTDNSYLSARLLQQQERFGVEEVAEADKEIEMDD